MTREEYIRDLNSQYMTCSLKISELQKEKRILKKQYAPLYEIEKIDIQIKQFQKDKSIIAPLVCYYKKTKDKIIKSNIVEMFGKKSGELTKEELKEYNRIKQKEYRNSKRNSVKQIFFVDVKSKMNELGININEIYYKILEKWCNEVCCDLSDWHGNYCLAPTKTECVYSDEVCNIYFNTFTRPIKQIIKLNINGVPAEYETHTTHLHTKSAKSCFRVLYYFYPKFTRRSAEVNGKFSLETFCYGVIEKYYNSVKDWDKSVEYAKLYTTNKLKEFKNE